MPPVLAGTAVLEKTPGNLAQAKGIVGLKLALRGKLPHWGVAGGLGSAYSVVVSSQVQRSAMISD